MAHTVMPRTRASCNTPITFIRPPLQHQASLAPRPDISRHAVSRVDESPQRRDRLDPRGLRQMSSAALAGTTASGTSAGRTSPPQVTRDPERTPLPVPGFARDERVRAPRPETARSGPFGPVFSAGEIRATRWLLRVLGDRQLLLVPPEGIDGPGILIDDTMLTRLARIRVICRVDAGPFGIIVTSA